MGHDLAILGKTPFAVVDVEATGIYPTAHDRIIEVAIIRLGPDAEILDEYVTLVNPKRDIGRSDIHGITSADIISAPIFTEIAGEIGHRLSDAIVVGHQVRFDMGFLAAEFSRASITIPEIPHLCTLRLAHQFSEEIPSRKLAYCCEAAGILLEDEHTALGDARATAHLLSYYLKQARERGVYHLAGIGCENTSLPPRNWCPLSPTGKSLSRNIAKTKHSEERTYLARLVERMLGDEAGTPQAGEYLTLLDHSIEDRRISKEEAEQLIGLASSLEMTRADVLDAHRSYLASLASEALADGVVTSRERRDLESVCDMLDLNRAALEEILTAPQATQKQSNDSLRGKSVCFTGELTAQLNGERITRDIAERLSMEAGLRIQSTVTKALDILVVADPHTQSGKANKAREYGIRIISDVAFWQTLGIRTI